MTLIFEPHDQYTLTTPGPTDLASDEELLGLGSATLFLNLWSAIAQLVEGEAGDSRFASSSLTAD